MKFVKFLSTAKTKTRLNLVKVKTGIELQRCRMEPARCLAFRSCKCLKRKNLRVPSPAVLSGWFGDASPRWLIDASALWAGRGVVCGRSRPVVSVYLAFAVLVMMMQRLGFAGFQPILNVVRQTIES